MKIKTTGSAISAATVLIMRISATALTIKNRSALCAVLWNQDVMENAVKKLL